MNGNYSELIRLFENSQDIAIFMHINPDGDCVCSALALYLFLKKIGKNAVCFAPDFKSDSLPEKLAFLPNIKEINSVNSINKYDLCVGVDVGDEGRLGDSCFRLFLKGKKTAVIDHHSEHKDFANLTVREENAASTTQILYKILSEYNKEIIDDEIATCLYVGLLTDSGGFSFDCTSSETHWVASELLRFNFNVAEINRIIMKDIPLNVFRLKNRVLSKLELYEDNKIALIFFNDEDFTATDTNEKNTDGIINNILNIIGVELAVSVCAIGEKSYKVSFRSKNSVDASACAKCFGGGGHFHAAGCRLYGYYEDVHNKLLDVAKEMLSYA